MNENGINHSSSITPIANLLVPTNRSHFRLYDDPEIDNWNDYIMHGLKVTLFGDKLVF